MISFECKLQVLNFPLMIYKVVRFKINEPYFFYWQNNLVGTTKKVGKSWKQQSGKETMQEIIDAIGKCIELKTSSLK